LPLGHNSNRSVKKERKRRSLDPVPGLQIRSGITVKKTTAIAPRASDHRGGLPSSETASTAWSLPRVTSGLVRGICPWAGPSSPSVSSRLERPVRLLAIAQARSTSGIKRLRSIAVSRASPSGRTRSLLLKKRQGSPSDRSGVSSFQLSSFSDWCCFQLAAASHCDQVWSDWNKSLQK
jgi:hypothetical protein